MKEAEKEVSFMTTTYGLVTSERILEKYHITLSRKALTAALENPNSFYHHLLRVPLKNVLNGIVLQQANEYEIYAQKLFIDYLMSGESGKPAESVGEGIREELAEQRKILVNLSEGFQECEYEHNTLIADSQKKQIHYAAEWHKLTTHSVAKIKRVSQEQDEETIAFTLHSLLAEWDVKNPGNLAFDKSRQAQAEKLLGQPLSSEMQTLLIEEVAHLMQFFKTFNQEEITVMAKVEEMGIRLRQWRSDFSRFIQRVNELLLMLPEYKINHARTEINKESLYFDANIGKEKGS
ncbi:MAG: hypothetical protein WC785_09915 [Tatlockia sp.]|jgi:hypothetical protein